MPRAHSIDLRTRIVETYLRGEGSYTTLGKRFCVSREAVRDIVQLFKRTGSVEPLPPSGGNTSQKLFENHYQEIEAWLDDDPNLMWPQVADKLLDQHNITITPSQLSRMMKRRGYTRKKNTTCDPKVDDPEIKAERGAWRSVLIALLSFKLDRLVFVDETATYTHMQPRYGYARRGKRVVVRAKSRPTRYTLVGAMCVGEMLAPRVWCRAMSEDDWVEWVIEDLLPTLKPGSIVIWDNLNIHYNQYAIDALEEEGHVVLFQSRYSPDFNPIEKAWSKLKTLVRGMRPRGAAQLRAAIAKAWEAITPRDIDGYFSSVVENAWEPQW